MCEKVVSEFLYLISPPFSWEKHEKMRDLNSYSDDIQPAMLRKIVSVKSLENQQNEYKKNNTVLLEVNDEQEKTAKQIKELKCSVLCEASHHNIELKSRIRTHHTVDVKKTHSTKVFKWPFPVGNNLKGGPEIHSGNSPHEGKECGKQFKQSGHLKRHMITHTGETSYKCEKCGKQVKQSGHLKRHMVTHTGETQYKCEKCGKQFNGNDNLKLHMRTHTGKTP